MSLKESIKDRLKRAFKSESESSVRRLQWLRLSVLGCIALGLSYGIVVFLFESPPGLQKQETLKLKPTPIETASSIANLDQTWRHKMEEDMRGMREDMNATKELIHTIAKDIAEKEASAPIDTPYSQELENKIRLLEERIGTVNANSSLSSGFSLGSGEPQEVRSIAKFSLSLSEDPKKKKLKTVDTTIPAGAFAKTVLLSGLDASASMTASSDPRPMLLRIVDPGTLPRRFQSDLKDCHCTAGAYGDLSSERVYARLEKLTCIERKTGEVIETQVAGYIAGADGKTGIRGIVASKDGQFLGRSLVGGMFAGLSNVANPQNRQSQVSPFFLGTPQAAAPSVGDMFTSGMASGASTALDRLSQYYIDRAEQLQPVIQIAAGQVVDIVFTEGTFIGSQDVHEEIEAQRVGSHQLSETSYQKGD